MPGLMILPVQYQIRPGLCGSVCNAQRRGQFFRIWGILAQILGLRIEQPIHDYTRRNGIGVEYENQHTQ